MSWIGRHVGHVRVEALLGRGGMGEVYRGFDELLERPVALKILHERASRVRSRQSLLREARLLCKLDHPNVCKVYDLALHEGHHVLVLELIDGRTLTHIVEDAALDDAARLQIALQVASALHAAHQHGIVHRDLKPDNVMLTVPARDGQSLVRVLDFGLAQLNRHGAETPSAATRMEVDRARAAAGSRGTRSTEEADGHTRSGAIAGTLSFMSPEQARGEAIGPPSDLYSFGILLQELMTRSCAYPPAGSMLLRLEQVATGVTIDPAGVDPDLRRLLQSLKSLRPEQRPTASEALAALRSLADKPRRTRRRRFALVAGFALVGLLGAVAWLAHANAPGRFELPARASHLVAVFPLTIEGDIDGRTAEAAAGYPHLLAEDLANLPGVDAIPSRDVARWVHQSTADGSPAMARERLAALAQERLGADVVAVPSLRRGAANEDLVFELRLWSGTRSVQLATVSRDPTQAHLDTAKRVRELIGGPAASGELQAVLRDPTEIQLYALARQRWDSRGSEAARPFLEALLALRPDFARGRNLYGDVLWHQGDVNGAERIWLETLAQLPPGTLDETRAEILYQLVWLEADRGRFREASDLLADLETTAGRSADAMPTFHDAAAYLAGTRGDSSAAINHYQQLVALTRQKGNVLYQLVALNNLLEELVAAQRIEEAGRTLAEATRLAEAVEDRRMHSYLAATHARLLFVGGTGNDLEFERVLANATVLAGEQNDAHLRLDVEELAHRGRVRRDGIRAELAEVDRLASEFRRLETGRKAAVLRIATARELLSAGDDHAARRQVDDLIAHEGRDLLRELAPDLIRVTTRRSP